MKPVTLPIDQNNKRLPQEPATFRHYMPLQMRFSDIDMVGHMNNSVYITFFDMAKTRYFMDVRPGAVDWFNITLVIVNVNCDFYEPTYFTDSVTVYTRATRISSRSVTVEQRIVDDATGRTKSRCVTVLAGFDPATATGIPIEEVWIEALEEYEGRQLLTVKQS